jgi:hypothetical protein
MSHYAATAHHAPPSKTVLRLVVHLHVSPATTVPVLARFTYRRTDPLAIVLDFPDYLDEMKPWFLSRDLLREGLRSPVGLGEVRIWPPCTCHDRPQGQLELRTGGSCALFDIPWEPLEAWL